MVSNLVVRNKRTGYVTFVAKARVDGDSRTVEYICGLGSMTQEEFKAFQKWAHSMKDQEMRRARVLACPFVVKEKEEVTAKVAAAAQKKTTVKRAPKEKVLDKKKQIQARVEREKEWYKALSEKEKQEYKAKQKSRLVTQTKELKERFKVFGKVKGVTYEGIKFTHGQTTDEKKKLLDERITQLTYHIENTQSDIRGWQKDRASGWKISDAKEKIACYGGARTTLRKQRAELRR